MKAATAIALLALVAGMLVGCPKPKADANANANADAGANADASAKADAGASVDTADGHALVVGACLSCHTEHMLLQQRLTEAQWQKVVTKMVGWGANLDPTEVRPLVAYLSASYGPDAGEYAPETISAATAAAEIAPLPDDPLPAGDAERGKPVYVEKCSACHGADARGAIGVLLVERPLLYRAPDVVNIVRKGRGKMLPVKLSDAELADILAHLRRLRNPTP